MQLRPLSEGALHGWSRQTRGSLNVMLLVVFLLLLWVGDEGTLRSSIWEVAGRLGTLNPKIPSLSDVA